MICAFLFHLKVFFIHFPFEDVLVNAIGGFLGWAALFWLAISKRGVRLLRQKFNRPSLRIELRKTPENIFSGIELGAPARWIEQQLGAPTKIGKKWWGYRFSDSMVSLCFDSNDSVVTISVALIDNKTNFKFPAEHFDCPNLGKLRLSNLLTVHELSLQYKSSYRHSELLITGREGPKGAWHYIAFGALSPQIPGPLLEVEFTWDSDKDVLTSQPVNTKINWAAISNTSEIDTFPWDFGIITKS